MTLAKLRRVFEALMEFLTMLMVVALTIVVILGVTFRFAGDSLSWYDEVASVLLAWVTYYGAALAALKRAHISVPGLVFSQPPRVRIVLVLVGEAIVLAFFVLLAMYGFEVIRLLVGGTLVSLPVPVAVTQSVIPIAASLFVIAELLNLPVILREARTGRPPPTETEIAVKRQESGTTETDSGGPPR